MNGSGDTAVEWYFTFRDFGMETEISRRCVVRRCDREGFFVMHLDDARCSDNLDEVNGSERFDEVNVVDGLEAFKGAWDRVDGREDVMIYIFQTRGLQTICFIEVRSLSCNRQNRIASHFTQL